MNRWIWLPTLLSLSRVPLGLAFPILSEGGRLVVVVLAALTDWADGAVSRWLGAESDLGRLLDPAADKAFLLSVLLTLGIEQNLTWVEVLLLGARDVLIGLGALAVLFTQGRVAVPRLRPMLLGKATTVAQLVFLFALLLNWHSGVLLMVTATLGLAATADYAWRFAWRPREEE